MDDKITKQEIMDLIRDKSSPYFSNLQNNTDVELTASVFENKYNLFINIAKSNEILEKMLFGVKKEDWIIFDVLYSEVKQYTIENDVLFLPFDKFFVNCNIPYLSKGGFYTIEGLMFFREKENIYIFFILTDNLGKNELQIVCIKPTDFINVEKEFLKNKINHPLSDMILYKIKKVLIFICSKMNHHEYLYYKKYVDNKMVINKIVYSHDVKNHKRHFWKDSGRFRRILNLSNKQLYSEGYGIDEVVYRNNELRRNVPYTLIGTYKIEREKERKENKKLLLFEKRIWKNQTKLGFILKQIFPNECIRSNDRKAIKSLELDFNIIKKKLAFEYDGKQHYDEDVCKNVFKEDFKELQKRDRKKEHLCRKENIKLIRIKYDEPLNIFYIKNKIINCGYSL